MGQQKTTTLDDGSVLQLNTNSQVNVAYTDGYRDISLLQGEAFFEVAKDRNRPLRVYVGKSRVEAIGTAFSVYRKGETMQLKVREGKVRLDSLVADRAITTGNTKQIKRAYEDSDFAHSLGVVSAGQEATVEQVQDAETIRADVKAIAPDKLEEQLSWRTGLLIFKGEPLDQVVAEVSRYTTVSIEIVDESVKGIKIGGQVRVDDPQSMLDALEANFGIKVTRMGYNHVQLSAVSD